MTMPCTPRCYHVKGLQVFTSRGTSRPAPILRGMALRVCTLLAVLIVTTQHTEARPSQRVAPMMYPIDQDPAENAYDPDQRGSREMASLMYQMLQRAAQQQQQEQLQQVEHQEEGGQDSNPMVPEDFPIVTDPLAAADKRGSYMSLCHFKICNMGRKRNLRKSQWSRF